MSGLTEIRAAANQAAVTKLLATDPVLVDVVPALHALPGMTTHTIAPHAWSEYQGGQRRAILGAALYEGLAATTEEADALLAAGEIVVKPCHDHACVGFVTSVTSASMPVWVVEDRATGTRGH
ncbi:DUF1116 domain-containing protein [Micromonospora inyonensis]|uniref:oxamate carbamoyltransferase subunit AllG family protein n=1 Tax=Micromonospora inyonensis TaxID=47866 RepID=UPI000B863105|nr:DUF1116 domain-containing protein [Micromonospora inyonensis]